jgi:predicted RNase H-like HicB family nuclease
MRRGGDEVKLKIILHEAEEGGYWAEVPSIEGCVSQGETLDALVENISEAVEGCLSVDISDCDIGEKHTIMDIAV